MIWFEFARWQFANLQYVTTREMQAGLMPTTHD